MLCFALLCFALLCFASLSPFTSADQGATRAISGDLHKLRDRITTTSARWLAGTGPWQCSVTTTGPDHSPRFLPQVIIKRGELPPVVSDLLKFFPPRSRDRLCGLAVRHSLRDREVPGSIPGRLEPRTLKLALAADPPSVWHYGFSVKSDRPGVRIM
ncbi:hypothetical protein ElyMa_003893700 [Elysia marginata]|uniref:Uncharacterized protein n=1 Tax=Elysia marginata TaxID=1093978 RepID=A0AAV4FM08_9GAST|nr:hypothetical protein ElyMa_003893700 [Elysia marginata]